MLQKIKFCCSVCSNEFRILYRCHFFSERNYICVSFTSLVELVYVLVLFLFHWSYPVTIHMSDMFKILIFYLLISYFNACYCSPIRNLCCTDHIHAYERVLNMGWYDVKTKLLPLCWLKIITPYYTSSLEKIQFVECRTMWRSFEVDWLKTRYLVVLSLFIPHFSFFFFACRPSTNSTGV